MTLVAGADLAVPLTGVPAAAVATGQNSAEPFVARWAAPCALPNAGTDTVSAATSTTPAIRAGLVTIPR